MICDEPCAWAELCFDVRHRQFAGGGVEVRPADHYPCLICGNDPGSDVGIVIQAGHDDLVTRAPCRRQGAGQIEGHRGHAASEDHPVGVGVEQVAQRATALPDNLFGVAFRPGDRSAVRQRTEHRVADGIGDGVRRLRAARAVEVCGSAP